MNFKGYYNHTDAKAILDSLVVMEEEARLVADGSMTFPGTAYVDLYNNNKYALLADSDGNTPFSLSY